MQKAKTIVTVQHPESAHHTNGMIGSWTEWELSELGQQEAKNIALNLVNELPTKDYTIYSSPLLRARQTASIIGEMFGVEPIFIDALRERNLGKAVGKSVQWLKENIEQEEVTVYDRCFSDAESRSDVYERLVPVFKELIDSKKENILIISHGDTLSIFNALWLGHEIDFLNKFDLYGVSGGVSFLHQTSTGKRIIRKLSDTSYKKI